MSASATGSRPEFEADGATAVRSRRTARCGWSCVLAASLALASLSCGGGRKAFKAGVRSEVRQDYDTALRRYESALEADPTNPEYKLRLARVRFEAAQFHVRRGQKLRESGDLGAAAAEFQRALAIDPSSHIAAQELRHTLDVMTQTEAASHAAPAAPSGPPALPTAPPQLAPLSRAPITLKLTSDARVVFETIGKLAGISVLFDPDFPSRRISTELIAVSLEEALELVALQSRAFWKPVTSRAILVIPDQPQKRRDHEEQVIRTFYLSNALTTQDLTELTTGLRTLLDLRHVHQLNSANAILIRDTPDKILLAEKIIRDADVAKPEVVIQVSVLQVRRDHLRSLGIQPGTSTTVTFAPGNDLTGGGAGVPLDRLRQISAADYRLTLPGAVATALLSDSSTKIIQNPEIRILDGQSARLRVGDRVPIATGSFQAGIAGTGAVSPLVNTQFQYQDVGVNVDITPRVHAGRDVSLKVVLEVSSVTGRVNIGGIEQPVISQRRIEHDIRLRDNEVSILGGLFEQAERKSVSGWPGLSRIPLLRYFFSGESAEGAENEVLILLTPRIVRLPELARANFEPVSVGTDTNIQIRRPAPPEPLPPDAPAAPQPEARDAPPALLRLQPETLRLRTGEQGTVEVVAQDVKDLFALSLLLGYDPAVVSVEEVRHGGFLSGGTQEVAIILRNDAEKGQAMISALRQPNSPGVNGSGTLLTVVLRARAKGHSPLSVVQLSARDSRQRPHPLRSSGAAVQVE